ncbi:TPA: CBASS cGAMP synthase [Aeromonas hydrophila]
MKYSANKLLSDKDEGFIHNLEISQQDRLHLEKAKHLIRTKLKDSFIEFNRQLEELFDRGDTAIFESLDVSPESRSQLHKLGLESREQLKKITPLFYVQGSYAYKTINAPCHMPPQQMDLDDGVYLPMDIFEERPIAGKELFFKTVDKSLRALAKEQNWEFKDNKVTCARLIIRSDMHIDIPLYAVPSDKTQHLEKAALNRSKVAGESMSYDAKSKPIYLDPNEIFMAVRNEEHWIKSDPAKIKRWFNSACDLHGESLRRVCRYLKAWRDYKWPDGGPSSITLMACAVETFNNAKVRLEDDSEALNRVSNALPAQLSREIMNPTDDTEPPLFPRGQKAEELDKIRAMAQDLASDVDKALNASTRQEANFKLRAIFGPRLPNKPELITDHADLAVKTAKPIPQPQPNVRNMKAG